MSPRIRVSPAAELSVEEYHAILVRDESEAHFQAWLEREARQAGCLTYHTNMVAVCECCRRRRCPGCLARKHRVIARGSDPGFPDLVIARADPPLLVVSELKSMAGRPTAEQLAWLEVLRANEVFATTWRPDQRDEIREVLRAP